MEINKKRIRCREFASGSGIRKKSCARLCCSVLLSEISIFLLVSHISLVCLKQVEFFCLLVTLEFGLLKAS